MKVLLLNPPGKKRYSRDLYCSFEAPSVYYFHPADLLIQSGFFRGEEVSVLDCILNHISQEEALKICKELKPNFVLSLCSKASEEEDKHFLETLKTETGTKIIVTGDLAVFQKDKILKWKIDGVLLSFVSSDFKQFMSSKKSEKVLGQEGFNKPKISYPVPIHEIFKGYKNPFSQEFVSIFSSFGCPSKCSFCHAWNFGFRLRDLENLCEEIEYVKSLGINHIYFRDATINTNIEHLENLCNILKKFDVKWNCFARPDNLKKDILKLMKDAGCILIQFGVESSDDRVLKKIEKGITTKDIEDAFKNCTEVGIDTSAHFIIGLKKYYGFSESYLAEIDEDVNFADRINCTYAVFNSLRPQLGSKLSLEKIKEKEAKKWLKVAYRKFYLRPKRMLKVMVRTGLRNIKGISLLK